MTSTKGLFEARELSCRRGGRMLFRNLSFRLQGGEALHLRGSNGSGKTSLLRVLAGALPPASGQVLWNSRVIGADDSFLPDFIFVPAHDRYLRPQDKVIEHVRFWGSVLGADETNVMKSLTTLELDQRAELFIKNLSTGQRRRLALASIFLKEKELWFLDEPFNGLDVHAREILLRAISAHLAAGGLCLIASHQDFVLPDMAVCKSLDLDSLVASTKEGEVVA